VWRDLGISVVAVSVGESSCWLKPKQLVERHQSHPTFTPCPRRSPSTQAATRLPSCSKHAANLRSSSATTLPLARLPPKQRRIHRCTPIHRAAGRNVCVRRVTLCARILRQGLSCETSVAVTRFQSTLQTKLADDVRAPDRPLFQDREWLLERAEFCLKRAEGLQMVFDQRAKNLKVKSCACRRAYIAFCTAHGCLCQSPMAPARRKTLSPPAPTIPASASANQPAPSKSTLRGAPPY
jgi:hypothetical protein